MSDRHKKTILLLAFTAIFVGYLMVWLPGPAAGLQFLGFEMGEWSKFLGVGPKRNWFYLPPVTLALMLLFFSSGWENGRYQTWLFRLLACAISLLAFPALEDLTGPPQSEYFSRLAGIGLVLLTALLTSLDGWQRGLLRRLSWGILGAVGLVGLVWPTLIYLEVRPFAGQILGTPLGFGPGFWLNLLGHGATLVLAVIYLAAPQQKTTP